MNTGLSTSDSLIPTFIAAVVLAAVAAFLWSRLRAQAKKRATPAAAQGKTIPASRHLNLDYKPEARPVSPLPRQSIPRTAQKPGDLPLPEKTSVIEGAPDVTASLQALVKKYSLDEFTIATSDGLVFASGGGASASGDAARFGGMDGKYPPAGIPGITLFVVRHKGSSLTGIIHTNLHVPAETRRLIEQDTQDILNRWI